MKTTVITPPDGEPVSLSAVKDYLRIGHEGEDELIGALIGSARARLETELGVALVSRVLKMELSGWPVGLSKAGYKLNPKPVISLTEIAVVDAGGEREVITARFMLHGDVLCVKPWAFVPGVPTGGHVEVTFEAGFGAAGSVPDDLQLAVKMLAAYGYRLRSGGRDSDEDALPVEVDELLAPYKGVRL